jgi:hypothetical protein
MKCCRCINKILWVGCQCLEFQSLQFRSTWDQFLLFSLPWQSRMPTVSLSYTPAMWNWQILVTMQYIWDNGVCNVLGVFSGDMNQPSAIRLTRAWIITSVLPLPTTQLQMWLPPTWLAMLTAFLGQASKPSQSVPVQTLRSYLHFYLIIINFLNAKYLASNGINMPNALVKTPSPQVTKVLFKYTLPRLPLPLLLSMDKVLFGPKFTLLVSLTRLLNNGLLMSSTPTEVGYYHFLFWP